MLNENPKANLLKEKEMRSKPLCKLNLCNFSFKKNRFRKKGKFNKAPNLAIFSLKSLHFHCFELTKRGTL